MMLLMKMAWMDGDGDVMMHTEMEMVLCWSNLDSVEDAVAMHECLIIMKPPCGRLLHERAIAIPLLGHVFGVPLFLGSVTMRGLVQQL